ncbi:hypothetical protein KKD95_03120, partial [Patescibacteria group bacterium]|nr:hypothetical protein [Patescibacteria group bacterium]
KASNGNYYRQLSFYRMLLARSETPRHMHEGVIEFVEPDEKDRIRTEVFEISEDEVLALETEIQRVAAEILSLSFWNQTCDDSECAWCSVRFG